MARQLNLMPLFFLLFSAAALSAEGGQLDQAREDARRPGSSPGHSDSEPDDEDSAGEKLAGAFLGALFGGGDEDSDGFSGVGVFLWYTILTPYSLPRLAMGDMAEEPAYFLNYPYEDERAGFLVPGGGEDYEALRPEAFRVSLGFSSYSNVDSYRTEFLVSTHKRFGFRAAVNDLVEELGGGETDELVLGEAALLYRFAQHRRGQMRSGLGNVSMLGLRMDGPLFVYEGDFFPVKPLVLSMGIDYGTIGSANVIRGRVTVGATLRNVEIGAGYSSLSIGSATFEGLTAHMRVWY